MEIRDDISDLNNVIKCTFQVIHTFLLREILKEILSATNK